MPKAKKAVACSTCQRPWPPTVEPVLRIVNLYAADKKRYYPRKSRLSLTTAAVQKIYADHPTMTLQCVAGAVGVSRERVRQIVKEQNITRYSPYQLTAIPLEWPCPDCGDIVQTTTKKMKMRASRLRGNGSDNSQLVRCKKCVFEYASAKLRKIWPPMICADCGKESLWKGSHNAGQMRKRRKTPYCNRCWGKRSAVAVYHQPKTHCKHGHEFTEENTYVWKGNRRCRTCNTIRHREKYIPKIPKTHCKHGHEFTEENTYITKSGRQCKTCNRLYHRARYLNGRRALARIPSPATRTKGVLAKHSPAERR